MSGSELLALASALTLTGCLVEPGKCLGGRVLSAGHCVMADAGMDGGVDAGGTDSGHDAPRDAGCSTPTDCPAVSHADSTCTSGRCSFSCVGDYEDCNDDPTDGCEASLADPNTCGNCETNCATPMN